MSLTLKLTSLLIRTASKPIGVSLPFRPPNPCKPDTCLSLRVLSRTVQQTDNTDFVNKNYIKRQAREHPTFRTTCVSFAQSLHRIDMRMRLGLLQDPAIIDQRIARETEKAEKGRKARIAETIAASNPDAPPRTSYDVPTKEETEEEAVARKKEEREAEKKVREEEAQRLEKIRIRPLSEAKAIDSGANFVSEAFLFLVAGGLILFESLRSRRKEASRREDVRERIEALEAREVDFERRELELENIIGELRVQLGLDKVTAKMAHVKHDTRVQDDLADEQHPQSSQKQGNQDKDRESPTLDTSKHAGDIPPANR
ncbi:hypothetical protein FH972_026023 [Carpinus fangiana]|uniref:OPA3-like protein n=1 Tax=Carpinus fangiana TaxID=176857 RepID=A0A5N6L336_9ROSI|nr:hypothetical protein FH972_026023 [Carpinus fangiana]